MDIIEQQYSDNYNKKSVVIIGSGPCGIISLKYLINHLNVICIEAKDEIGGMWKADKYSEEDHPDLDQNAFYHYNGYLPSSLYENLEANTPRCLMKFKDSPHKELYQEFMTSGQFIHYLNGFCSDNNLKSKIRFKTYVSQVRLSSNLSQEEKDSIQFPITKRFLIQVRDANNYRENIRYLQADSVIVSNGHCSVPNYADIPNFNLFKGYVTHSHNFRLKAIQKFKNKHLVIYGSSLSAQDILYILLRKVPKEDQPRKITLIGNEKSIAMHSKSTVYKSEIESKKLEFVSSYIKEFISENALLMMSDQKVEDIDCFMYSTGFIFKYPFLDFEKDNLIQFNNESGRTNSFGPLYKRLFSAKEPNLIFMGLMSGVLSNIQLFEKQAICISRFLKGEITLPSSEEMQESYAQEFETAKYNYKDGREYLKVAFSLPFNEIKYYEQLAELAQIPLDQEFINIIQTILIPALSPILTQGDYPLMKSLDFTDKIPLTYTPKSGFI